MPANLPPDYYSAEKVYKSARTTPERIAALEKMLSVMPHHKGTDKLRAGLNRKISQLRLAEEKAAKSKHGSIFNVDRQGAAQVALVGMPNTGKSSIVSALTHATPDIADYPYTTTIPIVGMMPYEDIQIQMVDLPPLGDDIRKLPFYNLLRNADALLVVADGSSDPAIEIELILSELEEGKVCSPLVDEEEVPIGAVRKKMLIALNKCDDGAPEDAVRSALETTNDRIGVVSLSVKSNRGLEDLKKRLFEALGIMRVYTKVPHKPPDMDAPFVLPAGSTVMDLAREIHRDFADGLKFCRVWGSARFDGQSVQRDHVLVDGDVAEMHL